MDDPQIASDGFSWGFLDMYENTGFDIRIPISGDQCVIVRVQNRNGFADIICDGLLVFRNGHFNVKGVGSE